LAFDTSKLKFGDMIAGGAGLVLFISLFLDWYTVSAKAFGFTASAGGNAFDALGIGKVFLLLVVVVAIGTAVIRATGTQLNLPVPLSVVVLGAGALASLYILFRIFVDPVDVPSGISGVDVSRSIGIYLAFLSALAITAGGYLSTRERGDAIPGVGGTGFGGAGTPLGGGGAPAAGGYQATPTEAQPAAAQPAAAQPAAAQPAAASGPKADWYPDPQGQARLRYWDGTQWTDQTAD
jgi:hypothetical protein